MSKEAITKVVQRAISDAGFRRQLSTDPTGALRGFDLSADETAALRAGDAGRLSAMGVDQRMSKAFALGGATIGASRTAGSDLSNASSAMASDAKASGNALVSDNISASDAMISDGGASARTVIPTDPHLRNADADTSGASARSVIRDDPDGLLQVHADRESSGGATARIGDDWKFASTQGSAAPIEGSPEAAAAELQPNTGGMANYPAHDGLAGPSGVASAARTGDDWKFGTTEGSASSTASDNAARLARLDEKLVSEGSPAVEASGGAAGETTAFIDDSEGYLTSVGYDSSVSTSAVTDAHDRGDDLVTRIEPDSDDAGGTSAASEDGPNISS